MSRSRHIVCIYACMYVFVYVSWCVMYVCFVCASAWVCARELFNGSGENGAVRSC